jgi:RNA polymerase sigma-70 factor (ECF subfamily)
MPTGEEQLTELRRRAFAIAYRMLGSVAEAEDLAQESMLRLHAEQRRGETIASPAAFVATIATRLSIDTLRSARIQRQSYVGEWLPEPLITDPREDPAERAELADSLSLAFLVVLERLTPEQRAVFLLREVFDYPYAEIAAIVGKQEQATRQLASRARRKVEEAGPRRESRQARHAELAERFFAAVERGELESLEAMLAEDVVLHGDGGGRAPALARALRGRVRAARALSNWGRAGKRIGTVRFERAEINAAPGVIVWGPQNEVISTMALEFEGEQIVAIRSVVNPDKLGHLGTPADLRALLKG